MKLVVTSMYREDKFGSVCGSSGIVVFYKDTKVIHVEKYSGKCTSKYVRDIGDFRFDHVISTPTEVGGVFEVEIIKEHN